MSGASPRSASLYAAPPSLSRARLSDEAALDLLMHGELLDLARMADTERRRHWPGDEVTFIVDRNINYTDYCLSGCRFCAFYKQPGSGQGYLLGEEQRGRTETNILHKKVFDVILAHATIVEKELKDEDPAGTDAESAKDAQ